MQSPRRNVGFEDHVWNVFDQIAELADSRCMKFAEIKSPSEKRILTKENEDETCQTEDSYIIPLSDFAEKNKSLENEIQLLKDRLYHVTHMHELSYDNQLNETTEKLTQLYDYNTIFQEKTHKKELENARRACRIEYENKLDQNLLQKYKREICDLRKKLNSEVTANLKQANGDLKKEVFSLKQRVKELEEIIRETNQEKTEIPEEVKQRLFDLESKIEHLELENDRLISTDEKKTSEFVEKVRLEKMKAKKMAAELKENCERESMLKLRLEELEEQLESAKVEIEDKKSAVLEMEQQMKELLTNNKRLSQSALEEESRTASLINELKLKHVSEVKNLEDLLKSKDADIYALKEEVVKQAQECVRLTAQMDKVIKNQQKAKLTPISTCSSEGGKEWKIKYVILHRNYTKLKDEFFCREKMLMKASSLKRHSIELEDICGRSHETDSLPSPFSGMHFVGSKDVSTTKEDIFDIDYSDDEY